MENHHHLVKLTAAEISFLWSTYISDSMSVCVLKYFLEHTDDEQVKKIVAHSLDLSQQHIEIISGIFLDEGIQIPQGFTEQDVNVKARRLFTDVFYLRYVHNMTKGGLVTYGRVLQNIYRHDIHSFFAKCLTSSIELKSVVTELLLEKGLAVRPPSVPYPQKLEFVHKQSFMLEGLGRRESLTGAEVTHLHANIQTNRLGTAMALAFSQVAESDKVRKYI